MLTRKRMSPVLCALTLLAVSAGVTAQEAEPRPSSEQPRPPQERGTRARAARPARGAPQPAPSARRPAPSGPPLSSAIQPTHLQVDVYELTCKAADLAELDTESLARTGGGSRQAIWDRLGQIGTVRVLALSDNVFDLVRESRLSQGQRSPIVSDMTTDKSGKAIPSINYSDFGLNITTQGTWTLDTDPPSAAVNLKLSFSGGARSNVTISDKIKLPSFDRLELAQELTLTSGRPVVFLGNDVPTPSDAGDVRASIIRVVAHHLPDARPAEAMNKADEPVFSQPTRVRIDWYELNCPVRDLLSFSSKLEEKGPTPEATLDFLRTLGSARITGYIDNVCDLSGRTSLRNGRSVPIVNETRIGPGGVVSPSVSYKDVGSIARLNGAWRTRDNAAVLDLEAEVEQSDVVGSDVRKHEDALSLPTFTSSSIRQSLTTRAGKPAFVIATQIPAPDGDDAKRQVNIVRIEAVPLPGSEPRSAPDPDNPARVNSRVQFDLFEFTCEDAEKPAILSAKTLEEHAATQASLLAHLDELGDVRLVGTVDQTAGLASDFRYEKYNSTPLVVDTTVSAEGTVTPSVNYKNVGIDLRMNGHWRDAGKPLRGHLWYDLDYAGVTETGIELASGIHLSAYEKLAAEQACVLASGEPVVIVTQGVQPGHGPRKGPIVTVMRIMAERLGEAPIPAVETPPE